ncbi:HPP family protein [Erythrobacter arachoides]|uniref:HPP family protein n=1 Tax=Aurantiacibacter arachoides TaxID=1850444 RepID=A0A845A4Y4_9SPHN|nr:HPP family protein [Aurantiacibacter arachoides]
MLARSASLLPQAALGQIGWLRGAVGAAIAIGVAALITQCLLTQNNLDMPWLMAPLGASAVLVFAVPASPLAQPWPVIGGNLISAAVGLSLGTYIDSPWLACSIAVAVAVAVMTYARCLHPPGGASALLCAMGASGADMWSWSYLIPIAANVLALSLVGWVYNNLTGHYWPHRVDFEPPAPPAEPALHKRADVELLLREWDEVLDVDVDDLDAFFRALTQRVRDQSLSSSQGMDTN